MRNRCLLLCRCGGVTVELGQDLVGGLGPGERLVVLVPGGQWVIPSLGGGGLRVTDKISARRTRRTVCGRPGRGRSGNPCNPRRTYRRRQAITVGRETPTRSAIEVFEMPSAARSRTHARWAKHGRQLAGPRPPMQLGQVVSSDWKRGGHRHAAWSHIPPRRQTTSATVH